MIGLERYRRARNPRRVQALGQALSEADLVLATTPALADKLRGDAGHDRIFALTHGAAGRPSGRATPVGRSEVVVGYMGSASHDYDLAMVAPALEAIAGAYSFVRVVLFGSIAEQPSAAKLTRVERLGPVKGDYAAFRRRLAELSFDIALAPLAASPFNRTKTATKWVEYAEAGAAVLASPLGPYAPIVAVGAALRADASVASWEMGLRRLIENPPLRAGLRARADALLAERYGWDLLEAEMLNALAQLQARGRRAA